MVSFSTAAILSFAAVGTLAAPQWQGGSGGPGFCMSASDAQQVATNYGTLVSAYTDALAEASLAENFTDYSESVNTLIDSCPIGSAAQPVPLVSAGFTNRAEFMKGQGQQPPMNFIQLNIWPNCDSVTLRWESTNTVNGTNVRPVVGIQYIHVIKAPSGSQYPYVIDEVHSEFDAGAWLQNLQQAGICKDEAPSNTVPAGVNPTGSASVAAGSASVAAVSTSAAAYASTSSPSWTTSTSSTVWWTPSSTWSSTAATSTSTWA